MRRLLIIAASALIAGCSGGLPSTAHLAPASTPAPIAPASPGATAQVTFSIVPTKVPASMRRQPRYVSYATQSAAIAITGTGAATTTTTINCTNGTCSGTVNAPVGTDTFSVKLYDQPNGAGSLLSSGSTTKTIVQNQANSVFITFDGIPASVQYITLSNGSPPIGSPSTSTVTAAVADADGYTIVGPGSYTTPITLTLTDSSQSTSLSKTTLTSPSDSATLSYNGTPKIAAQIGAAVQGHAQTATTTFEPVNVREYAIPTAGGYPNAIVAGADGAMWFTEQANRIGRIAMNGTITSYATSGQPRSIVAGPDGALWFSEGGSSTAQYGKVTTAGVVTEYALNPRPASTCPSSLIFGPDNATVYISDYCGDTGTIYAVTAATGAVVASYAGEYDGYPWNMVFGPDGMLYAGENHGRILRIDTSNGHETSYVVPGSHAVLYLANGPDGKIWFTEDIGTTIGNVTTSGTVTQFTVPVSSGTAWQIISGSDGALWFTVGTIGSGSPAQCRIVRTTTSGTMSSWAIADCASQGLAFGPDGNIWLAEKNAGKIGIFTP